MSTKNKPTSKSHSEAGSYNRSSQSVRSSANSSSSSYDRRTRNFLNNLSTQKEIKIPIDKNKIERMLDKFMKSYAFYPLSSNDIHSLNEATKELKQNVSQYGKTITQSSEIYDDFWSNFDIFRRAFFEIINGSDDSPRLILFYREMTQNSWDSMISAKNSLRLPDSKSISPTSIKNSKRQQEQYEFALLFEQLFNGYQIIMDSLDEASDTDNFDILKKSINNVSNLLKKQIAPIFSNFNSNVSNPHIQVSSKTAGTAALSSIISSSNAQKIGPSSANSSPLSLTMPNLAQNENSCSYSIQCLRQISESIKQHLNTQGVRNQLQKDFDLLKKKMIDCVPKSIRFHSNPKTSSDSGRGHSVNYNPRAQNSQFTNEKKDSNSAQSKNKKMKLPNYQQPFPYPTIGQIQRSSRRIRSVTPPRTGISTSSSSSSIKKIKNPYYNRPNLPNAIQQQKDFNLQRKQKQQELNQQQQFLSQRKQQQQRQHQRHQRNQQQESNRHNKQNTNDNSDNSQNMQEEIINDTDLNDNSHIQRSNRNNNPINDEVNNNRQVHHRRSLNEIEDDDRIRRANNSMRHSSQKDSTSINPGDTNNISDYDEDEEEFKLVPKKPKIVSQSNMSRQTLQNEDRRRRKPPDRNQADDIIREREVPIDEDNEKQKPTRRRTGHRTHHDSNESSNNDSNSKKESTEGKTSSKERGNSLVKSASEKKKIFLDPHNDEQDQLFLSVISSDVSQPLGLQLLESLKQNKEKELLYNKNSSKINNSNNNQTALQKYQASDIHSNSSYENDFIQNLIGQKRNHNKQSNGRNFSQIINENRNPENTIMNIEENLNKRTSLNNYNRRNVNQVEQLNQTNLKNNDEDSEKTLVFLDLKHRRKHHRNHNQKRVNKNSKIIDTQLIIEYDKYSSNYNSDQKESSDNDKISKDIKDQKNPSIDNNSNNAQSEKSSQSNDEKPSHLTSSQKEQIKSTIINKINNISISSIQANHDVIEYPAAKSNILITNSIYSTVTDQNDINKKDVYLDGANDHKVNISITDINNNKDGSVMKDDASVSSSNSINRLSNKDDISISSINNVKDNSSYASKFHLGSISSESPKSSPRSIEFNYPNVSQIQDKNENISNLDQKKY